MVNNQWSLVCSVFFGEAPGCGVVWPLRGLHHCLGGRVSPRLRPLRTAHSPYRSTVDRRGERSIHEGTCQSCLGIGKSGIMVQTKSHESFVLPNWRIEVDVVAES
ncbi:unnamed protein product [Caenorhabditis auriculariae]|uniref:Uncharacterized protein n=1 Tax=Caenorhabditis auriculariae TaxID=2777116 RepID=A0A8S1HT66_9PELO|nr:unnamed protein product [Caenorhabditis auriculariae]